MRASDEWTAPATEEEAWGGEEADYDDAEAWGGGAEAAEDEEARGATF